MKSNLIPSIVSAALIIAACNTSKKSTTSTTSAAPAATTAPTATSTVVSGPARPTNGVFAPGNDELAAIQTKYTDATMQILTEGHAIYTGVCTNCHKAKNIYSRPEDKWQGIMDNMAPKAKLTAAQKDAVYKYVLAIKATQPKEAK